MQSPAPDGILSKASRWLWTVIRQIIISAKSTPPYETNIGHAVAIAVLLPVLAYRIVGWIVRIWSKQLWDYGPAQDAWSAYQLVIGRTPYPDFRNPPYLPNNRPPVSLYLASAVSKIFEHTPMGTLEAGRLVTICATISVCGFIFLIARRHNASYGAALLGAFMFALSPLLEPFGFEFRTDMLALAFELAGLYLFSRGADWWSVAAFSAAFFTKQNQIAGIAAVALFCWLDAKPRRALKLVAVWLLSILFGIFALWLIFPYYLLNSFGALSGWYDAAAPLDFFWLTSEYNFAIFALAAVGLMRALRGKELSACFFLTALGQDLISCLRWGSNVYYYLPALAAAAILAAAAVDLLLSYPRGKLDKCLVATALTMALFFQLRVSDVPRTQSGLKYMVSSLAALSRGSLPCCFSRRAPAWDPEALRQLKELHGTIATDEPYLLLDSDNRQIVFLEFLLLSPLHAHKLFDDRQLLREITERKIAAFVLMGAVRYRNHDLVWPELRRTMAANYHIVRGIGPPYIMIPNSAPSNGGH